MTVLLREELNDADLAWAAAHPAWLHAEGLAFLTPPAVVVERRRAVPAPPEHRVVEPAGLRAPGAP